MSRNKKPRVCVLVMSSEDTCQPIKTIVVPDGLTDSKEERFGIEQCTLFELQNGLPKNFELGFTLMDLDT